MGHTALHLMIRESSPVEALEMVADFGRCWDIPDPEGCTAIDLLCRKRDPAFGVLAALLARG